MACGNIPFRMALSSLPLSLLSYLSLLASVHGAASPIGATWSSSTYGPDGPWPAVEVIVGNEQKIAMYPGREFASFLLTSDYCSYNSSLPCYASQAGLYNEAQSTLDQTGSSGEIQYQPGSNYMYGLDVQGAAATSWIDYIDLQNGGGAIPNVSMALVTESFATYPDGSWYPLSVGCLGIGAPDTINQSFSTSGAAINASLIPGYLSAHNQIASNSFGMHIGSANPKMPGSLYFGGYDHNRIVGDILSSSGDYTKGLTLSDIAIQVIDGSSPFSFGASQTGLLADGNSSIGSAGIDVHVDGCSPYLSLPTSTCDAIASHLPVTFNAKLGLYTWNTDDAKYTQIVNSASALEFTFLGSSNTDKVAISVPFRHLNLTLDAPLVDTKQQYFPCYTGPTGQYTLGRAFLQDAFVGANWGTKTWWLAQAPGPNVPAEDVYSIADSDTKVSASSNDWKESWSGSWKALTPAEVSASASVSAPTTTTTSNVSSGEKTGSLSTGAQAGIGVGAGIAGIAGIGALVFFFLRRRKSKANSETATSYNGTAGGPTPQHGYYEPVKNPANGASPGMAEQTMYNQQYPQQAYSPAGYPQQHYAAELPGAMSAEPQEMPTMYQTQNELPADNYGQHMQSPHSAHTHHS
ncbi:aspartic peptidase domain-containing protein [Xylariales sp. AK1849]|nr:aspartic peptidase domain-containing protein [Xylariales sp. AK1849]